MTKRMRTRTLLMSLVIAAMAFASCNKDEHESVDNWNGEIRLSSELVVQTRAADSPEQIANGQQVGVFIKDATTSNAVVGANLAYTADDAGGLALGESTDQPYYPASENKVLISAYHTHIGGVKMNEYLFTVATDQSAETDYYQSALLYSSEAEFARIKTAQSLTFDHKSAKVACNLIAGSGAPSATNATVEIIIPKLSVNFNRTTGAVGEAVATSAKSDNVKWEKHGAIIAPQSDAVGAKFLQVTFDGKTPLNDIHGYVLALNGC